MLIANADVSAYQDGWALPTDFSQKYFLGIAGDLFSMGNPVRSEVPKRSGAVE